MFKKPRELAYLSGGLTASGFIIQTLLKWCSIDSDFLGGVALALYFSAFPFGVMSFSLNWKSPRENRLGYATALVAGFGMLPVIIFASLVIIIYIKQ